MTQANIMTYIWTKRAFISSLVYRDIRNRYARSLIGGVWMIIEPLLLALSLSAIFTVVGRTGLVSSTVPFPLYFYTSFMLWKFFSKALSDGTSTFVSEGQLLKKYVFPLEILVGKNLIIYLIELAYATFAFAVILIIYQHPPTLEWIWLVPLMTILLALCAGMIFFLASINVYLRDVGNLVRATSSILFWLTPVIFQVNPNNQTRLLIYFNPMAGIIESFRSIVLRGEAPPLEYLLYPTIWATVLLVIGYWIFRKTKSGFIDAL